MISRAFLVCIFSAFTGGCSGALQEYPVSVSDNNLSDSYVHALRLSVNESGGFPGGLIGCSNGVSTASIATLYLENRPEFIMAEWQNILSNKYYRAKVPLDERTAEWLRDPPFQRRTGEEEGITALIVQWRGSDRVAVMLVADALEFSRGKRDVGEAVGQEIPAPENSPNHEITFETLRRASDSYFPGEIQDYDRTLDGALTREQRFGCPRKADGTVDDVRVPRAKLPFLTGANGEHVPCQEYFCGDKQALIKQLRTIGRRNYPPGSTPPEITFRDAANPKPAE